MFNNLTNQLTGIVRKLTGNYQLNEKNIQETLDQIRDSLIDADVPLAVVNSFLADVQQAAIGAKLLSSLKPGDLLVKIVHEELVRVLGTSAPLKLDKQPPAVILLLGLQGVGKTTTAAKLASWLKNRLNKSVLLTSVDIYRPAAMEQLKSLAVPAGAKYFETELDQSPVAMAAQSVQAATQQLIDVVIIDTAGRLHLDDAMMKEIQAIHQTTTPCETLLVVDSMTGQDAVNIARTFAQALPLTGVVLTKTDGDARGGAALAMRVVTKQPIKFIGIGEKISDLEFFHPDRAASSILGMGDILSLVEEVYHKTDQAKAAKLAKKFQKGNKFDLEDFRTQLQQMSKLGGVSGLMDKLPKLSNLVSPNRTVDDRALVRMEAIINSMTKQERYFPAFIRGSNKKRIALGSGTTIQEVNQLLKRFEQMQKLFQKMHGAKFTNLLKLIQGS